MLKKEVKKLFELDIINYLKAGLSPVKISNKLNISMPNLSYYLKTLKEQGKIIKVGYGTWEVKEVKIMTKDTTTLKPKEVRGHAFIWKIKIPNEMKGYNKLTNLKVKYKLVGIKQTPSILILNKKVWLGNNNIIIFDSNSYLGTNAVESRKYAVSRLLTIIQALERELGINLKTEEGYIFKPSREHYSLIKNSLAHQYNQEGKKLLIKFHSETWFLIDNSYNLDEAETIHKDTALLDNLGVQKFFNELKELNFEATPKETWKAINQVTNNQLIFAENMKSHIEAIQSLSYQVKRLGKIMNNTIKENKKLKLGKQKTLYEF